MSNWLWVSFVMNIFCYEYLLLWVSLSCVSFVMSIFCYKYLLLWVSFVMSIFCYEYLFLWTSLAMNHVRIILFPAWPYIKHISKFSDPGQKRRKVKPLGGSILLMHHIILWFFTSVMICFFKKLVHSKCIIYLSQ